MVTYGGGVSRRFWVLANILVVWPGERGSAEETNFGALTRRGHWGSLLGENSSMGCLSPTLQPRWERPGYPPILEEALWGNRGRTYSVNEEKNGAAWILSLDTCSLWMGCLWIQFWASPSDVLPPCREGNQLPEKGRVRKKWARSFFWETNMNNRMWGKRVFLLLSKRSSSIFRTGTGKARTIPRRPRQSPPSPVPTSIEVKQNLMPKEHLLSRPCSVSSPTLHFPWGKKVIQLVR